jgi:NAD(P)H-hydrate epimerase
LIEWANANPAPVLALDIPSGLDAETGTSFQPAIHADATATFLALKPDC